MDSVPVRRASATAALSARNLFVKSAYMCSYAYVCRGMKAAYLHSRSMLVNSMGMCVQVHTCVEVSRQTP
jgi:hypothetical protein